MENQLHIKIPWYDLTKVTSYKKGHPSICKNIDESGGHYARWNKIERERSLLYGIIYMWNLKKKLKADFD